MDLGRPIVTTVHVALASIVAMVAIIGMFGPAGVREGGGAGVGILGGFSFAFFIVLPVAGIVSLGVADWQLGRGPGILRAADVAAFILAALELSMGAAGLGRWLAGSVALLAAGGIAASVVVAAPRRPGFRR